MTSNSSLSAYSTRPQTGIISTLLDNLTDHANLAQESADAKVEYEALSQLLECKTSFQALTSLVEIGKLPEAVKACDHLNALLEGAPVYLSRTNVMVDIRVRQEIAYPPQLLTHVGLDEVQSSQGSS